MQLVGDIAKWEMDGDALVIEGIASTPELDAAGEKISPDAIRKALPEYLRSGSIREMHTLAAGRPLNAHVDEHGKLHLKARIIDPTTILKIKEGVLKMFSVGGKRLKQVGNTITELLLKEISVVDHGCNPNCHFTICKVEDTTEQPQNKNMKDELLKALTDPEVVAALKKVASPEAPKAEDLKKALGLDMLETQLIDIKKSADEAAKAAQKAERDALIAEASREGKVIPLSADSIAKMEVSVLKELVNGLQKGLVTTVRKQTVTLPEKAEDLAKHLETKRAEGAEALGRLINAQRGVATN